MEGPRLIWKLIFRWILRPAWRINNNIGHLVPGHVSLLLPQPPPPHVHQLYGLLFSSKLETYHLLLGQFFYLVCSANNCFNCWSRTVVVKKIDVVPASISLYSAEVRNKDISVNTNKRRMLFPLQDSSLFTAYQTETTDLQIQTESGGPLIFRSITVLATLWNRNTNYS